MYRVKTAVPHAHSNSIWSVSWGESRIVTGSLDESVRIWNSNLCDSDSPELEPTTLNQHRLAVVSVDVSGDGLTGVSSSLDGTIRVFDLISGKESGVLQLGPMGCWKISHHPSQELIATGTGTGKVAIMRYQDPEPVSIPFCDCFVTSVQFNPTGESVIAGNGKGDVTLLDIETHKIKFETKAHYKGIRSLRCRDNQLFSCSEDNSMHVYDIRSGDAEQIGVLEGHKGWVTDCVVSDNILASCSTDSSVKVWDLRMNAVVHTFEDHTEHVWGVSMNRAGDRLVSVGDDRALRFYSLA